MKLVTAEMIGNALSDLTLKIRSLILALPRGEAVLHHMSGTLCAELIKQELALIHDLERLKQSETEAINEVERLRDELKMARLEVQHAVDHANAAIEEVERLQGLFAITTYSHAVSASMKTNGGDK